MQAGAAGVVKVLQCNFINTKLKIIKNRSFYEQFFISYYKESGRLKSSAFFIIVNLSVMVEHKKFLVRPQQMLHPCGFFDPLKT